MRLLHSNDIHGNVEGLARVATLVEQERARGPVLYVDACDVEEASVRISAVTKGAAMHRVLSAAGCEAAAAGNAGWLSYGVGVLPAHAAEARYPLLLANIHDHGSLCPGVADAVLIGRVGLIGLTDYPAFFAAELERLAITRVPEPDLVRRLAASLRERGAEVVVVLSHLGLDRPDQLIDDRRLAPDVQGAVDVIVGAHSHDVLPEGEWIGSVLVVQTGWNAEYLGCVDLGPDGPRASLLPVGLDVPPHQAVLDAAASVEPEVQAILAEPIGELPESLDPDAAALWLAELLRQRSGADVGLVSAGAIFSGSLPAGTVRRGDLWDVCDSRVNPGVATMTGEQLLGVLARGRDETFAATTPRALRGRARGLLHASGVTDIDPGGTYRVAGTDWEIDPYGGLVEASWDLQPTSEFPVLAIDVIEEHLRGAA